MGKRKHALAIMRACYQQILHKTDVIDYSLTGDGVGYLCPGLSSSTEYCRFCTSADMMAEWENLCLKVTLKSPQYVTKKMASGASYGTEVMNCQEAV